jgi:16S rRNA C1402 N4-methylase RsmH
MQLIGKPQRASAEELRRNPRARSATLRVAQKLALADGAAANGVQH